jgi:Fe-S cluster biogenesis protein NfuA
MCLPVFDEADFRGSYPYRVPHPEKIAISKRLFNFLKMYYNKRRREMDQMTESTQIEMYDEVLEVLDKLRPFLQRDGGDVELVDVEDGIVKLKLMGACGSCPSSTITLKAGIERALLEEVEGIQEVVQVF